jgi:hypothetical protein
MSTSLLFSLSFLGLSVCPVASAGLVGFQLAGSVGFRQASAAVRLLRAAGWSRVPCLVGSGSFWVVVPRFLGARGPFAPVVVLRLPLGGS